MSEINWLHISDLHFGSEKKIKDIKTIRNKLLDYVKEKFRGIEFDYLFVTGDIFYGKDFFNDGPEKKQSIKDVTNFFNELISNINVDRKNVFIVPGNHDTDRKEGKKEEYINELRNRYHFGIRVFKEEEIQKYQKEFNNFCKGLKGINFCDKAHKFIERSNADILMLNTSISSCKNQEKKTELLLGKFLFEEELKKIKNNSQNWENESRPLFILAHHSPDYFTDDDREIIRHEFEGKKDSVLYLCGHNHFADVDEICDIHVLHCGSDVNVEKVGEKIYRKNEVNFLRGSFNTAFDETIVYFYKWHRRRWMENRDLRQDKPPHHAKTFGDDNLKTKILKSKSESEATMKFYEFLKNLCEKSERRDNCKCAYFRQEMNSLMDIIEKEKPEWRFRYKFEDIFNADTKILKHLKKKIVTEYQKYRETDCLIRQEINVLTDKIIEMRDEELFGILLYSKSMRVTNYLLSLSPSVRKKCIIYICAGNVRGNTKYKYRDGLDIAAELFDENASDFNGFNAVKLIPDIYIEKIIKQGKIHAVLFGAVALYYGATKYTHFSNTIGSKLIVDLASASKKRIYCIVIAGQSKALNLYPDPKKWDKKKEVKGFDYPDINSNLINNIKAEFEEFELVDLENIDYIISGREAPWIGKKIIPKEVFDIFYNELLKDKRELYLDNKEPKNATTITKKYLPEDKTIESDVISKLKKAGIAVPDIVDKKDDSITLKYYKGIRVFNFLVILDSLKNNEYGANSEKTNLLNEIAKNLLSRCEEKQKQIQKELYEQIKDSDNISPYPKSKLTNMIDLFFMCFNLEANKQVILKEFDWIYEKFEINAIVPFRDASTKNMILECKDLYPGLFKDDTKQNYTKQKEKIKTLFGDFDSGKLKDIFKKAEIIDIDFSSCVYYTTPYDDVISFRFHERTARYHKLPDNPNDLIWNDDISIKAGTEKESMVATFIMRLLRFGGRKLLYRVIDPTHHSVRFKYDSEHYYFRKILDIIKYYGFAESLPETIKLFGEIEKISRHRNFPVIPYDDKILAEKIEEIENKETYSDVFPF